MGSFRVKSVINLEEAKVDDPLVESDYSIITKDNKFIQYEYIDDDNRKPEPYIVKPGIWSIQKTMAGFALQETAFIVDKLLETYSYTKDIKQKINTFFSRFEIYRKRGRLPIRKFLLFGPAGTGKTSTIIAAIDDYTKDNKTATVVWHTDKFEAHHVKDFIQTFSYEGVEKLILVIEDIGGVEREEGGRSSESSLLSLLDNKEETFKIPTLVLATTNHPEMLLGNLTNRPGRFSDKIEVTYPKASERLNLLKFFYEKELTENTIKLITSDKTQEFTPDHIKNAIENTELYDKSIDDAITDMYNEIEFFKKAFGKNKSISNSFYD